MKISLNFAEVSRKLNKAKHDITINAALNAAWSVGEVIYVNNKKAVNEMLDSISEDDIERAHRLIKRTYVRYLRKVRQHESEGQ